MAGDEMLMGRCQGRALEGSCHEHGGRGSKQRGVKVTWLRPKWWMGSGMRDGGEKWERGALSDEV